MMTSHDQHGCNQSQSNEKSIAAVVFQPSITHSDLVGDEESSTSSLDVDEDMSVVCFPLKAKDCGFKDVVLSHLPDLVPTSLTTSTDNSISSLESSGIIANSPQNKLIFRSTVHCSTRTIFRSYWDSTKAEHDCRQLAPIISNAVSYIELSDSDDEMRHFDDCNKHHAAAKLSYERRLEQNKATPPFFKRAIIREVTVFVGKKGLNTCLSEPDLSPYEPPFVSSSYIRKASSTSALVPLSKAIFRSCLRDVQIYSGSSNDCQTLHSVSTSSNTSLCQIDGGRRPGIPQSVSFDPSVEVLEFNTPKESYAKDGWSKWFV